MKVHVEVTAEDIAAGVRSDCDRCPVALAVKRAANWNHDVDVGDEYIDLCNGQGVTVYTVLMPGVGADFIYDFDNYSPVQPIAFDLEFAEVPA